MSSTYSIMKAKTFLPVVAVVILWVITIEQNTTFKAVDGNTKISRSSAATKFSIYIQVCMYC